jgi:hypothetical protein
MLRRRLFTVLSALSLLLGVAVGVLWGRARLGNTARVGALTSGGRYVLRFDRDRLTLIGPPPAMPAEQEARAWELAGKIRNTDIGWWIAGRKQSGVRRPLAVIDGFVGPKGVTHWSPAHKNYFPDPDAPHIKFD